jgi:glutamate formiminotransferase
MTQDQPSRVDRIEALLTEIGEVTLQNVEVAANHDQALTRIEGALEQLTTTTERLATEAAQDRQQAAIDRQAFQTEIQRIWQYLLQQGGNGRSGGNQ